METLLTGGNGLLGRHVKIAADRPTHDELDITNPILVKVFAKVKQYDLVVHAAAYTSTTNAENNRLECFNVNVAGTLNLLDAFPHTPFVYISSEYAYEPVNFYSVTKQLAEDLVMYHPSYLIIRTLFKPFPYPYERAFTDQFTQGDTVDMIAPLIDQEIKKWDRKTSKLIYVGTGRKTLFELAQKSKPDVLPNTVEEWSKVTGINYPKDYV